MKGGKDCKALEDAFILLRGITMATIVQKGDIMQTDVFGLVEQADSTANDASTAACSTLRSPSLNGYGTPSRPVRS